MAKVNGSANVETAARRLLAAALDHVPFDGWSERTLVKASQDARVDLDMARLAYPRGAFDILLAFHRDLDDQAAFHIAQTGSAGRVRDRVTAAVRQRIELAAPYREAVRRGALTLALPLNATEGARILWRTADTLWIALGDPSRDYNWYSKRAILAGVYGATAMRWLEDDSVDFAATWRFLDRRIEGVMRFEKAKASLRKSPLAATLLAGPRALLRCVSAPSARDAPPTGMPGEQLGDDVGI